MSDLPSFIDRGERARLFPVLSETSKEGRTTSVFLSCLANVFEYGSALLASLGQRAGTRARIECFTEIGFAVAPGDRKLRPDGLIVLTVGSRTWTALVEAKVGANELSNEQIEGYLALAQANRIDAVISISNQFSASPQHHPLSVRTRLTNKVDLFHWSWMYLLTEADLLLNNDNVSDSDQHYMLRELVRFLTHPSAGVKGFDAMPKAWGEMVNSVRAGAPIRATSPEAGEVVGAWHQEVRDLTLILSRQVGVEVVNKLPKALVKDNAARIKADQNALADDKCLTASLLVPDTAAPIDVCVDLAHRTISSSARIKAPLDKQSTKARVNWMLRQLQKTPAENIYVRLHWPGRGPYTQHALADLQKDVSIADTGSDKQVSAMEVCMVRDLGGRFAQSRNFIKDLEDTVPDFYETVMQHLKAWQAPAPRLREGRTDASDVTPSALGDEVSEAHRPKREGAEAAVPGAEGPA